MPSYITSIGIANPQYKLSQPVIADFMANALQLTDREKNRLQKLYEASGIDYRYTVLEDYTKTSGNFEFFPNTPDLEPFPKVSDRMNIYKLHALDLSLDAINKCFAKIPSEAKKPVTHIITVSCTGMYAPGLDIEIIEELHLSNNIERTAINYMGCYAAFNGLKLADKICRTEEDANVLMICVELCSIHFQKSKEKDHLLANALFGDGAAAVLIQPQPVNGHSLRIDSFHCDLYSNGKKDMAWNISDFGFEMTLSSYIPELIKNGIKKLAENLLSKLNLSLSEIDYFAIHPGGRRILEVCEEELGMKKDDNKFAYHVLKNFGNMSSPTVLFVIHDIMSNLNGVDADKHLLSFAFGPGLTLESMLLKVQHV